MRAPKILLLSLALLAASCSSTSSTETTDTAAPTTPATATSVSDAPPTTSAPATSAATATTSPPNTIEVNGPQFDPISETIATFVADQGLNGAGFVIVDRDQGVIYQQSFGDFTDDRVSLIASSSKMITAGVLVKLHEDGLFDIDAPVADVAEWGAGNPEITTAQLLSNSSGLVGLLDDPTYPPYLCQYIHTGALQDCAETIMTTPDDDELLSEPDERFRYGGGQWQVAGAVAEVVSEKSWATLIDEIYVQPCGVDSLGYTNHYAQIQSDDGPFSYPTPFDGDPNNVETTENPNMEGGAYIDAGDYGALLLMHLRDGTCGDTQVLSAESIDRMHANRIGEVYGGETGSDLEGYGLGWWLDLDQPGFILDGGAFGSVPWIDAERGYGAYLVIEKTNGVGRDLAAELKPMVDAFIDSQG